MYRTALARRYRPRRFSEIVGQDHVTSTLRAAIADSKVAHAYLFCGPRGIGKTTAARVLAMALNCPERSGGEPCGSCDSCETIWSGRTSLDVVEIDAASNRGVDDARDLRERAMYAPSAEGRYKVYIVDEAHQLTREAWNALLKILEEPPPGVIFVFATTEPQKIRQAVPPAFSRLTRFDFRRVSVAELISRLRQVIELEGVTADEAALLAIARRAEGGVRDALSLLDQVLSFSGDRVGIEDVRKMLGLVPDERYLALLELARRGDRAAVFPFVQSILDEGYDLAEFVRGLGEMLRAALALRMDPEGADVELAEGYREQLTEAAAGFEEEELLRMLVVVADFEAAGRTRRTDQPRIQVEVLLLRLASLESSVALEELLQALGGAPAGERKEGRDREPARGSAARNAPSSPAPPAGQRGRKRGGTSPGRSVSEPEASVRRVGEIDAAVAVEPEPAARDALDVHEGREGPESAPPAGVRQDLRSAWLGAIEAARGRARGGQLVGLKGAEVEKLDGTTFQVRVPAGLATDLQAYLDDVRASAVFRLELARRLQIDGDGLTFRVAETGPRQRITAEAAREQRLRGLMKSDPRLREAVETLDLKLKE